MEKVLDVFWVKQFEKVNKIRLSTVQLDEARNCEGHTHIVHEDKLYEIVIPWVRFPFDLLPYEYSEDSGYIYPDLTLPWSV